jgi:hypothetical protein
MVATTLTRTRSAVQTPAPFSRSEIYHRLSLAIRLGDKERARRIYYPTSASGAAR